MRCSKVAYYNSLKCLTRIKSIIYVIDLLDPCKFSRDMSCENSTDPSGFLDLPSSYALLAVIAVLLLIICVTYSLLVAFLCKMYTVNCNACCEVGFLCCACRLSRRGRFEFERGRSERREGEHWNL